MVRRSIPVFAAVSRMASPAGLCWVMVVATAAWSGCGPPRTAYPKALQSEYTAERIGAIKHAAEIGDRSVLDVLVDRLEDEDEAVRFYAIKALDRLTGKTLDYAYYAPEQVRRAAVARWRRYLADQVPVDVGNGG